MKQPQDYQGRPKNTNFQESTSLFPNKSKHHVYIIFSSSKKPNDKNTKIFIYIKITQIKSFFLKQHSEISFKM